MIKYVKKPVVIEVVQLKENNIRKVYEFAIGKVDLTCDKAFDAWEEYEEIVKRNGMHLMTLESDGQTQVANIGDYIIKGVKGEFYPCKPDIFELTYNKVEK